MSNTEERPLKKQKTVEENSNPMNAPVDLKIFKNLPQHECSFCGAQLNAFGLLAHTCSCFPAACDSAKFSLSKGGLFRENELEEALHIILAKHPERASAVIAIANMYLAKSQQTLQQSVEHATESQESISAKQEVQRVSYEFVRNGGCIACHEKINVTNAKGCHIFLRKPTTSLKEAPDVQLVLCKFTQARSGKDRNNAENALRYFCQELGIMSNIDPDAGSAYECALPSCGEYCGKGFMIGHYDFAPEQCLRFCNYEHFLNWAATVVKQDAWNSWLGRLKERSPVVVVYSNAAFKGNPVAEELPKKSSRGRKKKEVIPASNT